MFPNILAAAAMLLIRQQKTVKPGDAIRDVVAEFYPRASVSHLYLARPFLWGERLQMLRGEAKNITWLLAVPVTNDELLCLETQGDEGLEQLYRQRRIDMYELERRNVGFGANSVLILALRREQVRSPYLLSLLYTHGSSD